jgi:membrane protease YdiL (CAAX protease family)
MEAPLSLPAVLLMLALFAAATGVYQNLLRRIQTGGGRVRTAEFSVPDLLLSTALVTLLVALLGYALLKPPAASTLIREANPLPDALSFALLISLIPAFLVSRGINVRVLLGLDRIPPPRAILLGIGLVAAAFPLVLAASGVTQSLLQDGAHEQDLVKLFRDVARKSDVQGMLRIFLSGVLLAPLSEEFLFRGYIYGVLKRYAGAPASAVFSAALFAAIHLNLSSLPSLFVLALCLTVAYEATGCWLVPVSMHAGFNFCQLGYLYVQAQTPSP